MFLAVRESLRGNLMKKNIFTKFLCAFAAAFMIILFANCMEKIQGQKSVSGNKTMTDVPKTKIKKIKKFRIRSTVDWEKKMATIYWKPMKKVSRYHMICYISQNGELEEAGEKDISVEGITGEDITEEGELFFTHPIAYGTKYEYEVRLYENIAGKECWKTTKEYELNAMVADLGLENDREETEEYARLTIYPYAYFAAPMGMQIFRGFNKEKMQLIDTVMWDELSDLYPERKYNREKQYTDKQKLNMACYQVRSFVDVEGKRYYGKKSDIKRFLAPGARGNMDVKVKISDKPQIKKMEIVLTNQSEQPIRAGIPYIKNYHKKYGDQYAFLIYDGENYPLVSATELQIDEISYKFHPSDPYQIFSEKDSVTINPGETIYLRFARKDHKKFKNFFTGSEKISIYFFQYLHEKVFLSTEIPHDWSWMGWGMENEFDYEDGES